MKTGKKPGLTELLFLAAGVYLVTIMLTNIFGSCLFNSDMYADAHVAKLMAEEGTLFPQSWVFGNQVYVIATPVVAALLCNFIGDSALALGIASCIMTVIEIFLFCWCIKPFCNKKALAVGLCCISGAVLIGQSFSTDRRTFQFFYTMASYYACYLIGIYLCMGTYFRLDAGRKMTPAVAVSCAVSFALGMQSPRETLVLIIPIALVELWYLFILKRKNNRRSVFVLLISAANICGLIFIKLLDINANPVIDSPALVSSFGELLENLIRSLEYLRYLLVGHYFEMGIKWLPLGVAELFVIAISVTALIMIIIRKDSSPIATLCIFCWISILGVLAVGTLLMEVGSIYYFVWYFLAAVSFAYMTGILAGKVRSALLILLFICAAGNWFYSFYPNVARYRELRTFADHVADTLVVEGVECIYQDFATMPIFVTSSKGKISSNLIEPTGSPSQLFCPLTYLVDQNAYKSIDPKRSRIVTAESEFAGGNIMTYLQTGASEEYRQEVSKKLTLESIEECSYMTLYIYSFSDSGIIAGID